MIKLRFLDSCSERRALGFLAGRFFFKTFADGITLVPTSVLSSLALEGISFTVVGRATYDDVVPKVRIVEGRASPRSTSSVLPS